MSRSIAKNKFSFPELRFSTHGKGKTGALLLAIWIVMVLMVWGFAFIPSPVTSSEWVMQAQAACFGRTASGLPEAHGWLLLILSPLAILSLLWASHADELYSAPKVIRHSSFWKLLFAGLAIVTIWEAHLAGTKITAAIRISQAAATANSSLDPLPLDYVRLNRMVPQFQLLNHKGQAITQDIFRGKVTFLTFAFAHCSTVCPMLIKDALAAQKKMDSSLTQTVIISIDPWRDTPSSLPSLAKTWSVPEGSHLLSGDPETVLKTLADFQLSSARNPKTGDINHAGQTMVVDQNGKIVYSFLNPPMDWLVTASARLLNQ